LLYVPPNFDAAKVPGFDGAKLSICVSPNAPQPAV
jgi:hypothetical protein